MFSAFIFFLFKVNACKLGKVTNFRLTIVGGTAKHSIDQYMVLFRYCSLVSNTAVPGGLHTRFCHTFLVVFKVILDQTFPFSALKTIS